MVVLHCTLDLCHSDFLVLPIPGFELGTSGSLVLHSTTVTRWFLVFTSDNFQYLTLVQRDWWWYCSDWTCERFSFCPHQGLKLGTSGSLVLHSTTVTRITICFSHSDNCRYLAKFGAEGMVVVLFWLDMWEIFFLPTPGFELGTSASLVTALYHCTTATSGFHLW